MSYYSKQELEDMGFRHLGNNVNISKKASIYGIENISIGNNVRIDDFCVVSGKIDIGNYVHIAGFCGLYGRNGITMKDFSGLSARVIIYSTSDDYSGASLTNPTVPVEYINERGGPVTLEKHVIIGAGSLILPDVNIGEGSAIGSMSMVNKNVEPWMIYAGIPAKPIKERKKDLLKMENDLMRRYHNE